MVMPGESRSTRRKPVHMPLCQPETCPYATLSTGNPTLIVLGSNSGIWDDRPATNRLSCITEFLAYSYIEFVLH
jgi:hypothetical protein